MTTTTPFFSPEKMYTESKDWLSFVNFVKTEYLFLLDTMKDVILPARNDDTQIEKEEIIDAINRSEKRNNTITRMVNSHIRFLEDCIEKKDNKNQCSFINEHKSILVTINKYKKEYYRLKKQLIDIIKKARKDEKLEYLLDIKENFECVQ